MIILIFRLPPGYPSGISVRAADGVRFPINARDQLAGPMRQIKTTHTSLQLVACTMASVPTGPATYGMEIYQQNDQPSANRFLEPQTPAGSTYRINAPMTPFSLTPDEFQNHSQKCSRVDSTVFDGPAQSRGFCHTNIILTDAATMDWADLSTVLMQIIDHCKELQLQVNKMEVNNMMAKIVFDSQVETLMQSLEEAKLATNMAPENKKTTKRNKAVKVRF
jgi:hypothetical protein